MGNNLGINLRYIKNMIGEDVPTHQVLRIGNLTTEDWDASMDIDKEVTLPRSRVITLARQRDVAMRALAWLMYKSDLQTYLYTPEYDAEVDENISFVLDHTDGTDPTWRFRVYARGEEDDSVGDEYGGTVPDGDGVGE